MRIEEIETILAHNWSFVRVHTDSGLSGIGEGTFWGYPATTHSVIEVLKKYLIGQDPLRIEHHWQNLYRAHCFRGAAVSSALAAIDIALWDIAGKHYGAPVYQLLGGMVRDKVRLYAMTGGGSVEEIVEKANAYVDEGYSAIKINPIPLDHHLMGHSELIKETVARVAAVRDAVGSHVDIGVEMHRKLGPGEAIAIGAELERFHLMFYEDPIPPENIQSWREGRSTSPDSDRYRRASVQHFRVSRAAGGAGSSHCPARRWCGRRTVPVQENRRGGGVIQRLLHAPQRVQPGCDYRSRSA